MSKSFKVIIVLAMCVLLVAGCSKKISAEAEASTNGPESLYDKELKIGHSQEFLNYTVYDGGDNGFIWFAMNCYDTLLNMDGNEIVPSLASSWEESDQSLVLHLREGVKFSDGAEFNADVVKLNIEKLKQIQGKKVSYIGILEAIKEIEVIDEYTIMLKFDQYTEIYLTDLATIFPLGMMSPNAFEENNYTDEVAKERTLGTGPYVLSGKQNGQEYIFERNDYYWGEKAQYEKVVIKIIPDSESLGLALRSGEIDAALGNFAVNNKLYEEFEKAIGFESVEAEHINRTHMLSLNAQKDILSNIEIRQAIMHAVNKELIHQEILKGRGEIANQLLHPSYEYCDFAMSETTYNTEKTIELLEKNGWMIEGNNKIRTKNGEKLTLDLLYTGGCSADYDIALTLESELKKLGIDINAQGFETMVRWNKMMSGEFDLALLQSCGAPYDPYVYLKSLINANALTVTLKGTSEKELIDRNINALYETTDKEKMQACFKTILNTINEASVEMPLYYEKQPAIFNSDKIERVDFNGVTTFFLFDDVRMKR